MDEPCRGTATADGVAVLASIMECLAAKNTTSIISTHFHEIFDLDMNFTNITCVHIDSSSRRIGIGRSNECRCLDIAKLSGIPSPILKRASGLLKRKYENTDVHQKTIEETVRQLLSEFSVNPIYKILPTEMPPTCIQNAIYVIVVDDQTIYCGESCGIHSRIEQHRKEHFKKECIFFVTECNNKTDGLQKEARMLSQKVPWLNVSCISDNDGFHTQIFL